jgi:hypothetical protein
LALVVELILGVTLGVTLADRPAAPPARAAAPAAAPSSLVIDGRTVRFIGLGGEINTGLLTRVGAEIGDAVDAVTSFWGQDWQHDILIVATATDDQFAAQVGPVRQGNDVAAVAVADRVDLAHRVAVGQRIVFAPGAAAMSDAALRIVLRHELFHYASRTDTAADAPAWLTEGVADYVGRTDTPASGPDPLPARLPTDAELDTTGPQRSGAYDRAWWFARFVADTYGPQALRRLYVAACGPGHADPATAVPDILGASLPEVLARWGRWLSR